MRGMFSSLISCSMILLLRSWIMSVFNAISTSTSDQKAQTPLSVLNVLSKVFWGKKAVFDPCPPAPKFDGLSINWKKTNYVNPPYEDIVAWIKKGISESMYERTSIFFIPFRTKSRYTHDIALPKASCIVIWMNRVRFIGYEYAIPATMCTYVYGRGVSLIKHPELQVHKVALHSWVLTGYRESLHDIHSRLLRRMSTTFGDGKHGTLRTSGTSVIIAKNTQADVERAIIHCDKHKRATVAVLMYSNLHTRYMRKAIYHIQDIIAICPGISFNNFNAGAVSGTIIICFGKKIQIESDNVVKAQLAIWNNGDILC